MRMGGMQQTSSPQGYFYNQPGGYQGWAGQEMTPELLQYQQQQYAMGWGVPQMDPTGMPASMMGMYQQPQSVDPLLGMLPASSYEAQKPQSVQPTRIKIMRDVAGPKGEIFTEEFLADVFLQDSSADTIQLFLKASAQLNSNNQDQEAVNTIMKLYEDGKVFLAQATELQQPSTGVGSLY